MAANIRTIGHSGLARALAQHDRRRDAQAERLRHEAKAANPSFIERLIAGGRKGTGCKSRIAIVQVMPVSDAIQRIIMRGGSVIEIAGQAYVEGVRDLRQAGLHKVKQGLTSLEEVMAVTNE